MDNFIELVYCPQEVGKIIKDKWNEAIIVDASDEVHPERFEVTIPNITEDDFYPFAIKEGFVQDCLGFQLMLQSLKFPEHKHNPFGKYERGQDDHIINNHADTKSKIDKWIAAANVNSK
jgi:hypothetical protein